MMNEVWYYRIIFPKIFNFDFSFFLWVLESKDKSSIEGPESQPIDIHSPQNICVNSYLDKSAFPETDIAILRWLQWK